MLVFVIIGKKVEVWCFIIFWIVIFIFFLFIGLLLFVLFLIIFSIILLFLFFLDLVEVLLEDKVLRLVDFCSFLGLVMLVYWLLVFCFLDVFVFGGCWDWFVCSFFLKKWLLFLINFWSLFGRGLYFLFMVELVVYINMWFFFDLFYMLSMDLSFKNCI